MHPSLSQIQNDVRAAELRSRAERGRGYGSDRKARRAEEIRSAQRSVLAPAFAPLALVHGFFGREHGSHA